METKHTPGPWDVGQKTRIGNNHFIVIGPPSQLAVANVWDHQDVTSMANANLMAAAPDLLESLQAAYRTFYDPECELGLKVRAAIAKATGNQP